MSEKKSVYIPVVEKPFYVPSSGSDSGVEKSFYVPSSGSDGYVPSSGSDSAWLMKKRSNHVHVENAEEKTTEEYDYDYDFNDNYNVDVEESMVIDEPATETELEDNTEKFVEQEITNELFIDGYLLDVECDLNTPYTCDDKLYDGCDYSLKDFCRYLLCLKNSIMVGDVAFCSIVGAILSYIPSQNCIAASLGSNSSVFHHLKVINYFANFQSSLQTFKFLICDSQSCVLKKDRSECCSHEIKEKNFFYYLPVRQRIEFLLRSDLRNFLLYPTHKYRSPKVRFYLLLFIKLLLCVLFDECVLLL